MIIPLSDPKDIALMLFHSSGVEQARRFLNGCADNTNWNEVGVELALTLKTEDWSFNGLGGLVLLDNIRGSNEAIEIFSMILNSVNSSLSLDEASRTMLFCRIGEFLDEYIFQCQNKDALNTEDTERVHHELAQTFGFMINQTSGAEQKKWIRLALESEEKHLLKTKHFKKIQYSQYVDQKHQKAWSNIEKRKTPDGITTSTILSLLFPSGMIERHVPEEWRRLEKWSDGDLKELADKMTVYKYGRVHQMIGGEVFSALQPNVRQGVFYVEDFLTTKGKLNHQGVELVNTFPHLHIKTQQKLLSLLLFDYLWKAHDNNDTMIVAIYDHIKNNQGNHFSSETNLSLTGGFSFELQEAHPNQLNFYFGSSEKSQDAFVLLQRLEQKCPNLIHPSILGAFSIIGKKHSIQTPAHWGDNLMPLSPKNDNEEFKAYYKNCFEHWKLTKATAKIKENKHTLKKKRKI